MSSALKLPIDIWIAAACALPWFAHTAWSYARPSAGEGGEFWTGRAYRWLDAHADYHLHLITWLAIDWLLLRGVIAVWVHFTVGVAVAATLVALFVWVLSGFGLVALHNLLLLPFARGRPLPLDLDYYFPASRRLEARWEEIREELLFNVPRLRDAPQVEQVFPDFALTRNANNGPPKETWSLIALRLTGIDVPTNMKRFPVLASLVADMPNVTSVWFSILGPGVELRPHRGVYRLVLRYHLGLLVPTPEKTWIVVGGIRYHWKEGESVLFDDVAVHSAYNHGNQLRVVLFIDVPRRVPAPLSWLNDVVLFLVRRNPYAKSIVARMEKAAEHQFGAEPSPEGPA